MKSKNLLWKQSLPIIKYLFWKNSYDYDFYIRHQPGANLQCKFCQLTQAIGLSLNSHKRNIFFDSDSHSWFAALLQGSSRGSFQRNYFRLCVSLRAKYFFQVITYFESFLKDKNLSKFCLENKNFLIFLIIIYNNSVP
jgi:hypothetical protein